MVELVDCCCWYFSNPIGMGWERGPVRGGEGRGALGCVILRPSQSDPSQPKLFSFCHTVQDSQSGIDFGDCPQKPHSAYWDSLNFSQFSLWFGRLRLSSAQLLCRRWRFHVTDCTNTQGLKITMENVLLFLWHLVNHNHYNFLTNHSVIVIRQLVAIMG